jgi:GIY-YIG catalytic domain
MGVELNINDLFQKAAIDPAQVIVLRHRPFEPDLYKILPWLAAEKPDVFNAYQQTQGEKLEKVFQKATYVASFIGHEPGRALFVGLYAIGKSKPLTREKYWQFPAYVELKKFGIRGFTEESSRTSVLWFDLELVESFYPLWKGKLVVGWPPPERSWWRRAHRNNFPMLALLEDSSLISAMPEWNSLMLKWEELLILPKHWKAKLSEWRGIYYIFDVSSKKGYVGSACGEKNILGRWLNYSATGHGGNALLRKRDPQNFRFSILERVSPDTKASDVIKIEANWKNRLHSHTPYGLNEN